MAYFAQVVHMVAEVHNIGDLHSEEEFPVPGHVVEVEHSQMAHEVDVCFLLVDSEECYYVPAGCSVEEVHFGECFGFVGEWEVASRSVQVCSAGEHEFVVALH